MPGASPENVRKVSVFSNYVVKSITFCKIRMVAISSSYKNARPYALAHNHEKWDILKLCLQNHQLHFSKQRENVLFVCFCSYRKKYWLNIYFMPGYLLGSGVKEAHRYIDIVLSFKDFSGQYMRQKCSSKYFHNEKK